MRVASGRIPIGAHALLFSASLACAGYVTTFRNFNPKGLQVTRFDTAGDAVDAHDGELAFFDGLYYLYGTSYDCGYQWGVAGTAFCGFKAYSSPDLVHWSDRGYLFDAATATWQARCSGSTYGCYRPHVLYHAASRTYVLWINVYDNSVGFRVFTSAHPAGPFAETAVPALAVNNGAPAAGLNNGDHDTFLDEDGRAYIAYTDWRTGGGIVIERLDSTYRSGSGAHVRGVTPGATEAPSLFRRESAYYLAYSDPNCGYCATGTSYRTASSPLGPWSAGVKLTSNSCGGQPSFVTPIALTSGTAFVYGSDLWNNRAKNEALANYYWAPLEFGADGAIRPIVCRDSVTLPLAVGSAGSQDPPSPDLDNASGAAGFTTWCDIKDGIQRSQSFVATRTGILTGVSFTTFQDGRPDAALQIDIHPSNSAHQPQGSALSSATIPTTSIGWSPRRIQIKPGIQVSAGTRYALVVKSAATTGCFGLAYNDSAPYPGGGAAYSNNRGATFSAEANRTLKFTTHVAAPTAPRLRDKPAPRGARLHSGNRRGHGTDGTEVDLLGSRNPNKAGGAVRIRIRRQARE